MCMNSVLIIGGNCDIGKALVSYYLNNNYNVIVGYHRDSNRHDSRVKYIKCDVTKEEEIENIIKLGIELFGNIDIIINLACTYMDNSFLNKTYDEFMRVLEVNLVGTFLCSQIYSRYIDNGLIINMASTDGIDTYSEYSIDYSASKAGVINMSKSISLGTNNRVLCIAPNWVETSSTLNMAEDYLRDELIRIEQSRLITVEEFISAFDKIVNSNFNSGDVYRIDIKGDRLWVEKV